MPQGAVLFDIAVAQNGVRIPLKANNQAQFLVSLVPGNTWYVNEETGNDANDGDAYNPFATLTAAQAAAVANNGDVVFIQGSVHVSAPVLWAKNGVGLVGLSPPSNNDRSRISSTGTVLFSPLVNVTAQGCAFLNVGTFHGGFSTPSGPAVCWAEAGGRNHYQGCQMLGGGDALTAALATMRSITIGGAGENLLEDCTFGLDTIVRASAANATMEIIGGSPRNRIRRSLFQSYCSDSSDVHILIASGGMDRYLTLEESCILHNFGATALLAAITNAGGSPNGDVILTPDCISVGAAAIGLSGNIYVGQIGTNAPTTTGLGILAT